MLQPDGWAFRARLGVIVPHAAIGTESELAAMLPAGVSLHATRVPLGVMRDGGLMDPTIALEPVRAFADPPLVDDAAALLAAAPLHAIGFAFTSSSYVRGAGDDEALRQRLEQRTRGIPVAITAVSAVLALRALDVTRVALVDPPWFSPELTALGVDYFRGQGCRGRPRRRRRAAERAAGDQSRSAFRVGSARRPSARKPSSSAATVCAPSASSRRWRKTCASRCSPPTRSCAGIYCGWRGRGRPSRTTASSSRETLPI